MKSHKIKTYNSEEFRKEYLNSSPELNRLFERSIEDFFCLRIEHLIERVFKPILPSREEGHTLIFVTEGSSKVKIGFKEYTVTAGHVLIIQARAVFSSEVPKKNIKGFSCHFHPDVLIGKFGNRSLVTEFEFLNPGSNPLIAFKGQSESIVLHLLQRLANEFQQEGKPNPDVIHAYLYALLTELKLLFGKNSSIGQSASHKITAQFRRLIHEKAKENLKASDFAELMNISPNHLNKSVRTTTAMSASELIENAKLIEIKYLLYQSDLSISEIAYEMGYLDSSYFSRFFKKREKVTPKEFRNMIEKS